MSFTNKVSNIIKQKIATNLISGFTSKMAAFGQPKKLAAKLASKSPLDLSKSPVAHMEAVHNPFSYGTVYYPNETSNLGEGHYIIFDVIAHKDATTKLQEGRLYPKSIGTVGENKLNPKKRLAKLKAQGFQTGDNLLRTTTNRMDQTEFFKRISDSIILYTPSSNKFSTGASYENAETGFLSDFLGGSNLFDALAKGLTSAGTKLAGATVTAALEIMVPGAGGFFNRSTGMSVNPNMELAFKSVPFRPFTFEYKFAPKNKRELDSVHKIIQLFRFHMSPALIGTTQYFAAPSQFQLTYMYREKENNYIPKIAKCVLENIEVDYSPGDKFTTLKPDSQGASPQLITVQMQFKEMSIITKETIAEGY